MNRKEIYVKSVERRLAQMGQMTTFHSTQMVALRTLLEVAEVELCLNMALSVIEEMYGDESAPESLRPWVAGKVEEIERRWANAAPSEELK